MVSFSAFVLLASATTTLAWSPLFERAVCNADNCLRAVTGTQPGQTQTRSNRVGDCSSFMVKTVTPETITITTTASFVSSTTTTLLTTTTTTTTAAVVVLAKNKRTAVTISPSNVPAYASPCSGVVRYSSACSCAGVTARTITVAAPTFTSTVSATSTTMIDVISTSTSIAIATPTGKYCPPAPPAPTCIPEQHPTPEWSQFFAGSGVSQNPNNPSNDGYGPWYITFPGTLNDCDAVSSCIQWGYINYIAWSIDVHYLIEENEWACIASDWDGSDASYFNVADCNIGSSYGYQT